MSWYGDAVAGWYRSKIASADAMEAGISQFGSALSKAIEGMRENAIANQIGTQAGFGDSQAANSGAYAPRAGLVSPGTNPDTGDQNTIAPGTSTQGTAPAPGKFTGGYKGLQLATAIDSLRRQQANTQSEIGLRQAQAGYYGAHSAAIQQNADTMAARERDYNQRINDLNNRKTSDTFPKLNTEINGAYGKGATPKVLGALEDDPSGAKYRGSVKSVNGQDVWVPDPNGNTFSPNAPKPNPANGGVFGIGAHGEEPQPVTSDTIKMPWTEAQKYQKRYSDINNGPSSDGAQGNQALPTLTPQEARQQPSGTRFMGTNGQIYTVP